MGIGGYIVIVAVEVRYRGGCRRWVLYVVIIVSDSFDEVYIEVVSQLSDSEIDIYELYTLFLS